MQPPSVPRKFRGHHDKFVMAAQANPQWYHGFCIPRKLCNEKNNTTRVIGKQKCSKNGNRNTVKSGTIIQ